MTLSESIEIINKFTDANSRHLSDVEYEALLHLLANARAMPEAMRKAADVAFSDP